MSPNYIVLGGGVMERKLLYNLVRKAVCPLHVLHGRTSPRKQTLKQLNEYVQRDNLLQSPETVIREPFYGSSAGIAFACPPCCFGG